MHLSDILGVLGGSLSIFMLIGRIIVEFYNNIFLRYELANAAFEPMPNEQKYFFFK